MLFLLFTLGKSRYGLEAKQVIEVVPVVPLRKMPHAPDIIAGCFNYRGTVLPVVSLQQLVVREPSPNHLSTRIIVVNYKTAQGKEHPLGLMADNVTEAVQIAPEDLKPSGLTLTQAPYLGSVAVKHKEMIQFLQINRLLPPAVQDSIFRG
jgi:chemotaxis-related protein WspB